MFVPTHFNEQSSHLRRAVGEMPVAMAPRLGGQQEWGMSGRINSLSRRAKLTFTLGGLFLLTTLAAIFLGVAREIGLIASICLLTFPLPPAAYLAAVRYAFRDTRANQLLASRVANVILAAGLVVMVFVSLGLLGFVFEGIRRRIAQG